MAAAAPLIDRARPKQNFFQQVFAWMFVGLAITGGIAAAIGSTDELLTQRR